MLCEICKTINVDELVPSEEVLEIGIFSGTTHHASFAELESAAKAGCELCKAIERCAHDLIKQPVLLKRLSSYPIELKFRLKGHANPGYQGGSKFWASCQGKIIAQLEAYVPRGSEAANPDLKLISGRPVSSDPASQDCFDVANTWLRECMYSGDHEFCESKIEGSAGAEFSGSQTPLPTRLIDVGPPDGAQEPRLILSSSITTSSSQGYAALSHCWGGTPLAQIGPISSPDSLNSIQASTKGMPSNVIAGGRPLTTLMENIEDRMKSIPMNILPRTFRDAVKVTRGLGLRYIWIDSLCIIQNSKSDWEQEAAQMADIYKRSYVTIAAEGSRDSYEGILRERHFDFSPIALPFQSKVHHIQTTMFVRPALDDWETSMSEPKSKLCSRAWVLQESLLAPRTIHYGLQQMLWECRSRSLAEGDMTPIAPSKREKNWSWSRNKRFLSEVEGAASSIGDTKMEVLAAKGMTYLQWYSIIKDYSSRRMTFYSDVFPALAGLATEFNRRLSDQYVAGLWKGDLFRGLLWTVVDSERAEAAAPYRAPTWSWASIVGQVDTAALDECLNMAGIYQTEILSVETTPVRHTATSSDGNYYGRSHQGV